MIGHPRRAGENMLGRSCLVQSRHVRTGVFLPPHHTNDEDVALCMQRDFELVQWVDSDSGQG